MTTVNVPFMNPNIALDAWIAEHVMRFKVLKVEKPTTFCSREAQGYKCIYDMRPPPRGGVRIWAGEESYRYSPTTDSKQAFNVLQVCVDASRGRQVQIEQGYTVCWGQATYYVGTSKDLCEAICLFAQQFFAGENGLTIPE